jgi:hypothetical protein
MVATAFQYSGAALLVLFLFSIWPPLVLAGAGLFFLLAGLALEGGK